MALNDSDKRDLAGVVSMVFETYRNELRAEFAQTAVCIIDEVLGGLVKIFAERQQEAITLRDDDRRKFFDEQHARLQTKQREAEEHRASHPVGFRK